MFGSIDHIGFAAGWQQIFQLRAGIIGIKNGKPAAQAQLGVVNLHNLQAQRVKGRHREVLRGIAFDALAHALAHFACGFVGEGDCGDALGGVAAGLDQMRNLFDDDPGLATAGTGQHQQGALGVQDCLPLGGIEAVQVGC